MSTALDDRRRPGLLSYFSFGSTAHRRTISSPDHQELDPLGKKGTPQKDKWSRARAGTLEGYREPSMTGGQRSRYLKTGGIIALLLFLLYLFGSRNSEGVREIVKGPSGILRPLQAALTPLIVMQEAGQIYQEAMGRQTLHLGRRSARSPA
jgi:hypothetical protein